MHMIYQIDPDCERKCIHSNDKLHLAPKCRCHTIKRNSTYEHEQYENTTPTPCVQNTCTMAHVCRSTHTLADTEWESGEHARLQIDISPQM